MGWIVNVTGATGLVGRELVRQLLEEKEIEKVRTFVRRGSGVIHPKLEEIVTDFNDPGKWKTSLTGDVLFSALGTTLKQAGSKKNQYLVDFTYQLRFTEEALKNRVSHYVLVSSAGASSRSFLFYPRMKGELEEKVKELPFHSVTILRPSILMGTREIRRPAEEWSAFMMGKISRYFLKKYRPVPAQTVARAMINALSANRSEKILVINPENVFKLAGI